ncbi:MAG: hypothetical protein HY690_10855 [Chloroflexi bacterium]|nr:hypothetical protein [Chloroflexota bacterium]
MDASKLQKKRGATQRKLLHGLLQRQGLKEGDYALFFVTGEGEFLPVGTPDDPVEESSGYVLDKQGHVFSFWFGWDPVKKEAGLTEWQEVRPEPHWLGSAEYRRAREQVGLPPT